MRSGIATDLRNILTLHPTSLRVSPSPDYAKRKFAFYWKIVFVLVDIKILKTKKIAFVELFG